MEGGRRVLRKRLIYHEGWWEEGEWERVLRERLIYIP